jgi:microcystin-dependent protein
MMKPIAWISAALVAMLCQQTQAQAADPFLTEIVVFSGFCPRGYAETRGQLLPINQNQALFSLFGTRYGGDGEVNFALPNFTAPFSGDGGNAIYCIALQGIFPSTN